MYIFKLGLTDNQLDYFSIQSINENINVTFYTSIPNKHKQLSKQAILTLYIIVQYHSWTVSDKIHESLYGWLWWIWSFDSGCWRCASSTMFSNKFYRGNIIYAFKIIRKLTFIWISFFSFLDKCFLYGLAPYNKRVSFLKITAKSVHELQLL